VTVRLALLALLGAVGLPSALAQADNPKLVAVVGTNDAFVISLRDASGNLVTHLDPGTYDIAVSDRSEAHNFHLKGPGVDERSPIEEKQEVTWTVTFVEGTYTFVCDAHASVMRGYFLVGDVPPTPVAASVGPGRKLSVRPKSVAAGPVTFTVSDRSRVDNFHLSGHGVNKKTGVAFRGRVTWKLTLAPGLYTYRSDAHKSLRGTFVVRFPG
jgi:plastocyanin